LTPQHFLDKVRPNGRRILKKPRIYIDGYNLSLQQGTGVATYARNLSYALRDLGAEVGVLYGAQSKAVSRNPILREVAFFDGQLEGRPRLKDLPRNILRALALPFGEIATRVPVSGHVIREALQNRMPHFDHIWNVKGLYDKQRLSAKLAAGRIQVHFLERPEVMHWTYPLALRAVGARNIYTLHDLVPLRLPYATLDPKRVYFRQINHLTKHADHLVTVSEASKKDIMSFFGVPEERITVTYQAVDIPLSLRNKPLQEVKGEIEGNFGIPFKGYFLYFGALEPRKNVTRMIEAHLASGVAEPLVIVGKKVWRRKRDLRLLAQHDRLLSLLDRNAGGGPLARIIQLEYLSFPVLIGLIRGAKAVLFPSLYEGFGLPALEAMTLGTPVLTSNTSSMPELVGDAALQIDPYDTQAMVEGIRALARDEALCGRLAEAGPKRAERFSVENYHARLAQLYGRFVQLPER
jgi:glycosyltransferase involved in cell wall biosynthesis